MVLLGGSVRRGKKRGPGPNSKVCVCIYSWLLGCKLTAGYRIFLRFVLTPGLENVIPGKPQESEVKMKTKVVASKSIYLS